MPQVRFAPAPDTHRHRVHEALERARQRAPIGDGGTSAAATTASTSPASAAPAATPATAGEAVAARYLSGVAIYRDRDGARALQLLGDESRRVRGIAFCVAPLACDDAQATEALHIAWSIRGERRLLRRMLLAGRTAAIDGFLDRLAANGQLRELIDDLPFGSEAAVRRHLAHALERPSHRFWNGLAHGYPALLAELLLARWTACAGEADPVTRIFTARHHLRIAERAPDAALTLAELLLARGIEPADLVWRALLRERPAATVALAIRYAARVPDGALAHRVRELAPSLLADIMRHAPQLLGPLHQLGPRIRTMSPERRRALADAWLAVATTFPTYGAYLLRELPDSPARDAAFTAWSLSARDRDGVVSAILIAALPIELAAREAARHVREVTALATQPVRRLWEVARFLPWAELEPALRDHLGHPDGAMRAIAITELLANPAAYPDDTALPDRALALVTARKFEQDPVRAAMLGTLAIWPRRIWRAAHLPVVAQILRDALDASDLSPQTAALAQRLVVRLFGVDAAWAATWLATTIKERGALYDANLGAKLSDADLRAAGPALLAIAKTWATQERVEWLLVFATGLGPRLALVDGLAELLGHARDGAAYEGIAQRLTELLMRHAPAHHAATVAQALARFAKRGWTGAIFLLAQVDGLVGYQRPRARNRRRPVLSPQVSAALVAIACDLDPKRAPTALALLRQRDPEAFDRVVPEIVGEDESIAIVADVWRWIHRHRQDLLAPYLGDRVIRGAWATGKTRWVLPFGDGFYRWHPAQVERYATALEAIVGDVARDTPAVIAALTTWPRMEYAAMDRLCACASDARPVVREKAIRVLARCDAGQGVPTLLACLGDERARFAIYGLRRALFAMPPDRALALLADAPMRKVTVAKEVVRLTGELRATGAFARLGELAASQLHRDVRMAVLRALWDHLDREAAWTILERAVDDPDWVVASRLADIPADRLTAQLDTRLGGLLARLLARPEPEARIGLLQRASSLALVDRERVVLAAIRARLASPYDDEINAAMAAVLARSTEADLAALGASLDALRGDPRAFHVAAAMLCGHAIRSRASWRQAARALVTVALRDPRWSVIAIQAEAARAIAPDLVATLERATLDFDATQAAIAALVRLDPETLEATVAALAASAHPAVRRLAVAALAHDARPGRGWTPARLAQLAQLRGDVNPEVAGAAARLWPPREQDPGWAP